MTIPRSAVAITVENTFAPRALTIPAPSTIHTQRDDIARGREKKLGLGAAGP